MAANNNNMPEEDVHLVQDEDQYECDKCEKKFPSHFDLDRHKSQMLTDLDDEHFWQNSYMCFLCRSHFVRKDQFKDHSKNCMKMILEFRELHLQCEKCGLYLNTVGSFWEHSNEHKRQEINRKCLAKKKRKAKKGNRHLQYLIFFDDNFNIKNTK